MRHGAIILHAATWEKATHASHAFDPHMALSTSKPAPLPSEAGAEIRPSSAGEACGDASKSGPTRRRRSLSDASSCSDKVPKAERVRLKQHQHTQIEPAPTIVRKTPSKFCPPGAGSCEDEKPKAKRARIEEPEPVQRPLAPAVAPKGTSKLKPISWSNQALSCSRPMPPPPVNSAQQPSLARGIFWAGAFTATADDAFSVNAIQIGGPVLSSLPLNKGQCFFPWSHIQLTISAFCTEKNFTCWIERRLASPFAGVAVWTLKFEDVSNQATQISILAMLDRGKKRSHSACRVKKFSALA